jgi:hypothetical protein
MSFTATPESADVRRGCSSCQDRTTRFGYDGDVGAGRDNAICLECFRLERDQQRAHRLADVAALPPRSPFLRPMTSRQVAHRHQMLIHLSAATPHRP